MHEERERERGREREREGEREGRIDNRLLFLVEVQERQFCDAEHFL